MELIFRTDVHIIGLSLDYSDIDLWWILNRRARILKAEKKGAIITNRVFYYETSIDVEKRGLLKAMKVEVVEADPPASKKGWEAYYRSTIKKIANKAHN